MFKVTRQDSAPIEGLAPGSGSAAKAASTGWTAQVLPAVLEDGGLKLQGASSCAAPLTQLLQLRRYVGTTRHERTSAQNGRQALVGRSGHALSVIESTGLKAFVPSAQAVVNPQRFEAAVEDEPAATLQLPPGVLLPPAQALAGVVQSLRSNCAYKRGDDGHIYRLIPQNPGQWHRVTTLPESVSAGHPQMTASGAAVAASGRHTLVDLDMKTPYSLGEGEASLGYDVTKDGAVALSGPVGKYSHGLAETGPDGVCRTLPLQLGDLGDGKVVPARPTPGLSPLVSVAGVVLVAGSNGRVYRLKDAADDDGVRRGVAVDTVADGAVLGFNHVFPKNGPEVLHAIHLDAHKQVRSMYWEPGPEGTNTQVRWTPGADLGRADIYLHSQGLPEIDVPIGNTITLDAQGTRLGFLGAADPTRPALHHGQLCVQDPGGRFQPLPLDDFTSLKVSPYGTGGPVWGLRRDTEGQEKVVSLCPERSDSRPPIGLGGSLSDGVQWTCTEVATRHSPVALAVGHFQKLYYATADGRVFERRLGNGNGSGNGQGIGQDDRGAGALASGRPSLDAPGKAHGKASGVAGGSTEVALPNLPAGYDRVTTLAVDRNNELFALAHGKQGAAVCSFSLSATGRKWTVHEPISLPEGDTVAFIDNTRVGEILVQGSQGGPKGPRFRLARDDQGSLQALPFIERSIRGGAPTEESTEDSLVLRFAKSTGSAVRRKLAGISESVTGGAKRAATSMSHKVLGHETLKALTLEGKAAPVRFAAVVAAKETLPAGLMRRLDELAVSDPALGGELRAFHDRLVQDFGTTVAELALRTALPIDRKKPDTPNSEQDLVVDLQVLWKQMLIQGAVAGPGAEVTEALLDQMSEAKIQLPYKPERDVTDRHGLTAARAMHVLGTLDDLSRQVMNPDSPAAGPAIAGSSGSASVKSPPPAGLAKALADLRHNYDRSEVKRYTDIGFRSLTELECATSAREEIAQALCDPKSPAFQEVARMLGGLESPQELPSKLASFYLDSRKDDTSVIHASHGFGAEVGWGLDFGNYTFDASAIKDVSFSFVSKRLDDSISFALIRGKGTDYTLGGGLGVSMLDVLRFGTEGHFTHEVHSQTGASLIVELPRVQKFIDAFVDRQGHSLADLFELGGNAELSASDRTHSEGNWEVLARGGTTTDTELGGGSDWVSLLRAGVTGAAGYAKGKSKEVVSSNAGERVVETSHDDQGVGVTAGSPIVAFVTGQDASSGWFSMGNVDLSGDSHRLFDKSLDMQYESREPQVPPAVEPRQVNELAQWLATVLPPAQAGKVKDQESVTKADQVLAALQELDRTVKAAVGTDGTDALKPVRDRLELVLLQHILAVSQLPVRNDMALELAGTHLLTHSPGNDAADDGPTAALDRWLAAQPPELLEVLKSGDPVFRCEMVPASFTTYLERSCVGWESDEEPDAAEAEEAFRKDPRHYRVVSVNIGETQEHKFSGAFNPVLYVRAKASMSRQSVKGEVRLSYAGPADRAPKDMLAPKTLLRDTPSVHAVVQAFAAAGMHQVHGLPTAEDAVQWVPLPAQEPVRSLLDPGLAATRRRPHSQVSTGASQRSVTSTVSNSYSGLGVKVFYAPGRTVSPQSSPMGSSGKASPASSAPSERASSEDVPTRHLGTAQQLTGIENYQPDNTDLAALFPELGRYLEGEAGSFNPDMPPPLPPRRPVAVADDNFIEPASTVSDAQATPPEMGQAADGAGEADGPTKKKAKGWKRFRKVMKKVFVTAPKKVLVDKPRQMIQKLSDRREGR